MNRRGHTFRFKCGVAPGWHVACLMSLGVVSFGLFSGCAGGSSFPPRPAAVYVTMSEFRFDYKSPIPPGRVVFRTHNVGSLDHELILLPLPKDFPPLAVQLGSGKPVALPTLASNFRRAGTSGTFAVDLEKGRYGMVSLVKGSDGEVDGHKGMFSEFRVG